MGREKRFGEYVRELREKKGMSQKELAEMVGATSSYICAIERGTKPAPPYWTVKRIAEALELDPEELWELARKERDQHARELARRLAYRRTRAVDDDRMEELRREISSLKEELREIKALLLEARGDAAESTGSKGKSGK